MKSYLILLLGIILSSSCGGTKPPSISHEIELGSEAHNIEQLRGVISNAFVETNFSSRDVFSVLRYDIRALPFFVIPSQTELGLEEKSVRFDDTDISPSYGRVIWNSLSDKSCLIGLPEYSDQDDDRVPSSFEWVTGCSHPLVTDSVTTDVIKEAALKMAVHDDNDSDPTSGFQHQIDLKRVIVFRDSLDIEYLSYALPSKAGYSTAVTEDLKVKRLADLHYSIALDRRRKAETSEGRKSGVALKMNMIADPERFENFEKIQDPKNPGSGNMIIRKFSDVRAKGKFQIVDGFIQFVVDSDVRTFKISSTPLVYEDPYVLNGKKSIPDQSYFCSGEAFSSGTITMTDVAGNKLELRYSRNPLNLPKEQGPGNCLLKYYLNDQELKTSGSAKEKK